MEINPLNQESVQTDAELLRDIIAEYNALDRRRQYLAQLIGQLSGRTKTELPPPNIQLQLEQDAGL